MNSYEKHGMRKYCPGLTSGLKAMSLLMMALVFMTFGSTAQAQFHGAGIQKTCPTQVRNCLNDADCSNDDGNLCTPEVCDTTLPRTTTCTIRAINEDDFGDSITIIGAFDEITTAAGVVRIPSSGDLLVSATSGADVTCTAGELPCTLLSIDAWVKFESTYTLLPADNDLTTLDDQATVANNDNCDGTGTGGCSSVINESQQTAASDVVDACSTGAPTECDDGNACTIESCNTGSGLCESGDPTVCDGGDACTPDFCNTSTGACEAGPPTVCDDGNACTVDSCNTLDGLCEAGPPTVCDDGNACTVDSCNTSDGLCEAGPPTVCDDGNACTVDSCNTSDGLCEAGPPTDCDDLNMCTDDSCNTETGVCVSVDNQSCEPIPTLSVGGMVAMILTLLGLGGILIRRGLLRKATRV
jgi:hypothetical protein